jgi:uncharacterized damage-inducible protein DinB
MPSKASDSRSLRDQKKPVDLGTALVEAFLTNERINQKLLDLLDPKVWDGTPKCSIRRNIATSFAHIHNVRCMRLKMTAKKSPARLDRATVTPGQARKALGESARAMAALIESSVEAGGHVPDYKPDVVALVCAGITHEAHHRGQICHWARELGCPITPEQQLQLWEWDKRWREVAGG